MLEPNECLAVVCFFLVAVAVVVVVVVVLLQHSPLTMGTNISACLW